MHKIDVFRNLTAQERQELVEASLQRDVPQITSEDIIASTEEVAALVQSRFEQDREIRPGFALVSAPQAVFQRAYLDRQLLTARPDDKLMYDRVKADGQAIVVRVAKESWDQEPDEDELTNTAVVKGIITAMTIGPSGSVSRMTLARSGLLEELTPDELDNNQPGAVLFWPRVFSVAGLYAPNNREIAELIGLGSLLKVQARATRAAS